MVDSNSLNVINLTREGIIVSHGSVLQKNIKTDIIINDNTLKLSFYDSLGIYNVTKMSLNKFSFLRAFGTDHIIGILSLDSDWYLCWNPKLKSN